MSIPANDGEWREIPDGWIKQYDYNSGAWYYVDTTRKPARSIWVHPHDDALFLRSHPQHKLTDELPPKEDKRGILGKIKANTFGRSERVRQSQGRQAQENLLHQWKERLARQKAHEEEHGPPPQWSEAGETKANIPTTKSPKHVNGHDYGHVATHTEGTSGGSSMGMHASGAVAGGEATGGGADSGAATAGGSGGGGTDSGAATSGGSGGGE